MLLALWLRLTWQPLMTLWAQEVVFGDEIRGEHGEWEGEARLLMPVGSALRVDGRAAGPGCKHAVHFRTTHPLVVLADTASYSH